MSTISTFIGTIFGDISFDSVLSEDIQSAATITDNPIETGAAISDHMFVNPTKATIIVTVSNFVLNRASSVNSDIVMASGKLGESSKGSRAQAAFLALLDIQGSAKPFDVVCGWMTITNCVIENVSAPRDVNSSGTLECTVAIRKIVVASVETSKINRVRLAPELASKETAESIGKVSENPQATKSWAASIADSVNGE